MKLKEIHVPEYAGIWSTVIGEQYTTQQRWTARTSELLVHRVHIAVQVNFSTQSIFSSTSELNVHRVHIAVQIDC